MSLKILNAVTNYLDDEGVYRFSKVLITTVILALVFESTLQAEQKGRKLRKERIVWLNGGFVPESMAKVSIFDSGFHIGDAVIEAMRTFNHKPFKIHEHLRRLYDSLRATRIDIAINIDEMENLVYRLIEMNDPCYDPEQDFWIYHDISRGTYPQFRENGKKYGPGIVIFTWPLTFEVFAEQYSKGVHLVIPSTRQVPAECLDPKIKHKNRLHFMLADLEAKLVDPNAIPLLLDLKGNISENNIGNFFIVKNRKLCTPDSNNVLRGVSRATVIELAVKLGIPLKETQLQLYDAYTADEAFITMTSRCIMPVTRINGLTIGDGRPFGPITKMLIDAWSELVGVNIVGQAQKMQKIIWRSK